MSVAIHRPISKPNRKLLDWWNWTSEHEVELTPESAYIAGPTIIGLLVLVVTAQVLIHIRETKEMN